ncbi:tRNA (adenosine(37)-N6)-dimethylallyltransferase MiaA [bacterium]|nr:tRNA (adenosine(37)-N6)-dimethylallyltransferase MiaA [bacterium]
MAGGRDRRRLCPVIAGPTAVGKSRLVVELAGTFPIEVISLDSRQVYHGLRIGTAQPSAEEQAACRHHLIDFLSPDEAYSAQRFRQDFTRVWTEITGRGKLPILVGGAGMYLKAVEEGFFQLPPGSHERLPAVRAEIEALPPAEVDRELLLADPASATRLHPNDQYRRRRALEVCRLTGRAFSDLMAEQAARPAHGLAFPLVLLERSTPQLDARIAVRTRVMLDEGWIEETRDLLRRHDPDGPGLRSIGYAEIVQHLHGGLAGQDLAPAIVTATRQYAKRQRTWFRSHPREGAGEPDSQPVRAALERVIQRALDALER